MVLETKLESCDLFFFAVGRLIYSRCLLQCFKWLF